MESERAERRFELGTSDMNILVIDDEEIMRNMISDVLTASGYRVWTASNGEEAIEKLKEAEFGIVITDIRMPAMDGVEVTRKLKKINSDICVIVITGYASIDSAIAVLKEGAYDYITKPFNIDEIRIVVGRAAERQAILKEAREKEMYQRLSIIDGLTQIYNRRYFDETLLKEVARMQREAKPASLLMIDIDHFKNFNDSNGHQAGDWALKRVSQVLAGSIRLGDYVFRYGGEEFVVLLPNTDKISSLTVARRLRLGVSMAKFLDKKALPTVHLTISIGLSTFPDDANDANMLLAKADEQLYAAKQLGRDRICFVGIEGNRTEVK